MANTYTRLYVHVVIRTKRGYPKIKTELEDELYGYIGAIIKNQGHIPIRINGISDHIHLLLAQNPSKSLSDLMREIKSESSRMINERHLTRGRFRWQIGFGAFSCDHHSVDRVVQYIANQKEHHKKVTYMNEYLKYLKQYGIDYAQKYLED
ncbi:MAG: IS200/IS605 family transposase [Candidatus Marinimicrobia bacterium]|nr:IS200/IS605 family transposase [Candidatus Neomarinimicrobiota bacterium]